MATVNHNSLNEPSLDESWISLPMWVSLRTKYILGAVAFAFAALIYSLANHYPIFPIQELPMTWVDQMIPFIPTTVWIYISEYIYFGAIYISSQNVKNLNRYLYAFLALQLISVFIFFIWPTTFPRSLYPLNLGEMDYLTYELFSYLRTVDAPTNCCPSLHVSSVYLSSFVFLEDQEKKFPYFFCWGTAIALSTLTTKQHYIIDVVTGLLMAVVFYQVFHRWVAYHPVGSQPNR